MEARLWWWEIGSSEGVDTCRIGGIFKALIILIARVGHNKAKDLQMRELDTAYRQLEHLTYLTSEVMATSYLT